MGSFRRRCSGALLYKGKITDMFQNSVGPDRETTHPSRCNLVNIGFSRISSVLYVLNRVLSVSSINSLHIYIHTLTGKKYSPTTKTDIQIV